MTAVCEWTVAQLACALQAKKISALEATQACWTRQAATAELRAYLYCDVAGALAAARAADLRRAAGKALGPWDGVPVALKDNFLTEGLPTTCGSQILKDFVGPYDATVVRRLKAAGVVLLGKLNMDEFAMGSSNEHSAFGPARNPYDPERVPGGSSGGSAVAVASGSAFASLGTDTGGSIRQPAAFTGIVGLKPTYGRVSRYGVVAYASSFDQVGPMSKDVTDCALMLQAIAGADAQDATCAKVAVPDFSRDLELGVKGMRLGVPKEYFAADIHPDVAVAVQAALRTYEACGAKLVDVHLPHTQHSIATYYVLASAEASSNLARFDGVRFGQRYEAGGGLLDMYCQTRARYLGAEVKRRIMLGTYVLSAGHYKATYSQAQKVRTLLCRDFAAALEQVDAVIMPTSPAPPFRLGEKECDPMQMYMADAFTVDANLTGRPSLSLPCGETAEGLPLGLQLLGQPWQEAKLLQLARAYEREHTWHQRRPAC